MEKIRLHPIKLAVSCIVIALASLALSVIPAGAASLPTAVTGPASDIALTSANVSGDVNPNGALTTWYFQYGTTIAYGSRTLSHSAGSGSATLGVSTALAGLTPGVTYHFRLVASDASGTGVGADVALTTPSSVPTITTGATSSIANTSATLSGTVNPNGLASSWYVRYGTSTVYGLVTPAKSAGSGVVPVKVSVSIGGLSEHTTYHFELVATNAAGSKGGGDHGFLTLGLPITTTGSATTLATTSATLNGTLDPGGHSTSWYFQYGTTAVYGAKTPTLNAGSGVSTVSVARSIRALTPGTTYHFRLVATNSAGESVGGDITFATPGPTLTSSLSTVVYGRAITISGAVPNGAANESVVLYEKNATQTSFVSFATVLTGSGGSWAYSVIPRIQTNYMAIWSSETSPTIAIAVAPSVSLRSEPSAQFVKVAEAGTLKGRLVRLERLVHGAWRTIAMRSTDRKGTVTFHPSLPHGVSRVRAFITSFEAGTGYTSGVSAVHLHRS